MTTKERKRRAGEEGDGKNDGFDTKLCRRDECSQVSLICTWAAEMSVRSAAQESLTHNVMPWNGLRWQNPAPKRELSRVKYKRWW